MQPPDITRVFKGPQNEFEVKIVLAREGNQSPKEGTYDETVFCKLLAEHNLLNFELTI